MITTANGLLSPVKSQAAGSVEKAKALHEAQMRNFHTARAAYFEWVEKYADWVASKLNPSPVLDGARERLKASIETAKTMTDPDGAVDTVHQAWLKFASFGPGAPHSAGIFCFICLGRALRAELQRNCAL